jgi:FkbM family methyltransferase
MSAHQRLKGLLNTVGLYKYLKYSSLYSLYWRILNPAVLEAKRGEERFYRSLFGEFDGSTVVFDIGANRGHATAIFLALGARVVAVEPDRENARLLRWRFKRKPVEVVESAVTDRRGSADFFVTFDGSAKNTLSTKWKETLESPAASRFGEVCDFKKAYSVATTTLDELISVYGVPAFIKIDVEGSEFQVLKGLRTKVPMIQFEVNLPEFEREGLEALRKLKDLDGAVLCNYSGPGGHALALSSWVDAGELAELIRGRTMRFMDVFAKMQVSTGAPSLNHLRS